MELRLKVREANSLSRYRPTLVNPREANGSDHPQVPLLLHLMVTGMKGMFINRQQPRVSDLMTPDYYWNGRESNSMDGWEIGGSTDTKHLKNRFKQPKGPSYLSNLDPRYERSQRRHAGSPRGTRNRNMGFRQLAWYSRTTSKPYVADKKALNSRGTRNPHSHVEHRQYKYSKYKPHHNSRRLRTRNPNQGPKQHFDVEYNQHQDFGKRHRDNSRNEIRQNHVDRHPLNAKTIPVRDRSKVEVHSVKPMYRVSLTRELNQTHNVPEDSLGSEAFITPPVHFGCLGLDNFFGRRRRRRRRRSPSPLFFGLIGPDCDYPKEDDKASMYPISSPQLLVTLL